MISLDSTIKEIMDNDEAKGICEKYFPGVSTNPMIKMVSGMTFRAIGNMPQAGQMGLTPEILAKIEEDFKSIP